MDRTRWERLQELFHEAADLPRDDQDAFLVRACAGDERLLAEARAMLREDARAASPLDRGVADVAGRVIRAGLPEDVARQRFGPYRLTRLLGEGGMGIVFVGERDDLESVAAVKILRDAWLSPARRDRFAREQRILAQLNHPHIARLYDAGTLPSGTPWLAMELVEGTTLTDYCRARQASVRERLQVFRDVCEAVEYAHRHLIVHRDLKPSNVLVTPEGQVKLLDFGISRQVDPVERASEPTVVAARLLTPAYASPEQLRGDATTMQTDVYALGVILYELLTGRLPTDVSGLSSTEAERKLLDVDPSRASVAARLESRGAAVPASAWPDLDVMCLTAMHKDLAKRYASVEALIRDVDHYLADEPLDARPDSLAYRAQKFLRRNWRLTLATASVLVMALALVTFYTVRLTAARNAAVAQAVRTDRIQRFMLKLFDGGDKDAGPADSLRVVTLVDRGEQEARALDREPLVQAELFQTLGGIYQKLGKLDRADALLQASLETRRAQLKGDAPDVARSETALALLRSDQARYDDAEQLARQALASAKAALAPEDPQIATATAAVGEVLVERGSYVDAIGMLEEAARLQSRPGANATDLAGTLYDLAGAHFYAGHLDASQALDERVLGMHRDQFGPAHPSVAEDLINLGAIQYERGRYPEAETFYRQALEINRGWYGKDSYRTASTLTMLGRALSQERRYDEAHDMLSQALAVQESVFGKVHPRVASALNDLGNVAMGRDQYDEAEVDFRRIGDIYRSVYGTKHYLVGIATSNLAGVSMARKQFVPAEAMYRQAIAIFTSAQGEGHLNTGIARIKLGRALLRQNRMAEAEPELKAGYDIVSKQAAPTVSWLKSAREDLATVYDALGRPADAYHFRDEAARVAKTVPASR
jgi:serine/threonine-protein kinase